MFPVMINQFPKILPRSLGTMVVLFASAMSAFAVDYARERYDLIVERSPFGEEVVIYPGVEQAAEDRAAAAAAQKYAKEMRLCYLLETESGDVRAGFQNLKAQKGDPKSIMLMVGESFKGMKLSAIDLSRASATLTLNGKPVTFELAKAPSAATKSAPKAPATPQRRFGGGFRRQEPQKAAEPELSPEEQAKKREEVRENLRQYQMEVIRAGMPPLPIPLTQDMDDQLVAEGVLPPPGAE